MTCIPETSTAQKCVEYRNLSLVSHASKILTRKIYHRIGKKIENLQEDQFGVRRNRGIREAILSLQIIMEETLRLNEEIMIVFIDIKNAVDNINWNIMFKVLKDVQVDYRDRRIILRPYKNQRVLIGRDGHQAKI